MLEAESALTKINLACDASIDHPVQGPVDGGPADPMILVLDQFHQIIRAQVPFLTKEHVDDQIALAGALGAGGTKLIEIRKRGGLVTAKVPGCRRWLTCLGAGARRT